jgi:hypothetical protein
MGKNTCNGCTACCVAFPLLPNPGWWPAGKPAYQPCPFRKDHGGGCGSCGIHDQPRPTVCTAYECAYIGLGLPERYWPKRSQVIITQTTLKAVLQDVPGLTDLDPEDLCVSLTEAAPRALLALDAAALRWHLAKHIQLPDWFTANPYGFDQLHGEGEYNLRRRGGIIVPWRTKDGPAYAEELYEWWCRV